MNTRQVIISPVDIEARRALNLRPGQTLRVWQKIKEKDKTRLQAFEGLLIARKHGGEAGGTFTLRQVTSGVGVEKIFPLYSPNIDKIEILRTSRVRRAKLYYIRSKSAKEIRRKMGEQAVKVVAPEEEIKPPAEAGEVVVLAK